MVLLFENTILIESYVQRVTALVVQAMKGQNQLNFANLVKRSGPSAVEKRNMQVEILNVPGLVVS